MMKRKILAWVFQSVVIFLLFSFYFGGVFYTSFFALVSGFLLSIAGIVVLPFSLLSDYATKRFSNGYRFIVTFILHVGVGIAVFVAAQGWVLSILYGFLYWLFDESIKVWQTNRKKESLS
ncbi:hypothetical protein [Shimazuella kribbensis]|uniref:hypothetical protein n=1 Tax=Shimazuella kribbensis TaxID=139808 RepID=UPI00056C6A71|nr:hypothetical protein [Shimazuella kribbensis]